MQNSGPKVSVIIPCFNQGNYIADAIESVLAQTFQDFEIIVVDDGSTDATTSDILRKLSLPKTKVFHSKNHGVSAARNLGICNSRGTYIFPLDADDKIAPAYLEKAVAILENSPQTGIVYCEAEFFGTKTGKWHLPPYRFPDVLLFPRIFSSALFRRKDWEAVGGYSTEMIYGWEDFDFWLSLIERNCGVHQIPEVLFFYRQSGAGMTKSMTREKLIYSYEKLFARHEKLYRENIGFLFSALLDSSVITQDGERGASCQVFLPAEEYSQQNSLRQSWITGRWTRLKFQLPNGCVGRRPLRIDPLEFPALVEIAGIRLRSAASGKILWSAKSVKEFKAIQEKGTASRIPHDRLLKILSTGNDPQLHLPPLRGKEFEQPIKLDMWVRATTDAPEIIAEAQPWLEAFRKRTFFSGIF